MPIINLQKRARELGRIRIGQVLPTKNGRTRPAKLDRFRLTSASRPLLEKVATLYGGTVQEWTPANGGPTQWEVITTSTRLPILVPPQPVSQWYELWSGGGCQRRCDGETEILSDTACPCAQADEMLCKPTTRLNVVLRDVEGIGVFRLESHGYYAAVELPDVAAFLAQAGGYVVATLSLEERVVKRDGETRRFMVPTIETEGVTPGELMAGKGPDAVPAGERPAVASGGRPAIEAPQPAAPTADDFVAAAHKAASLDDLSTNLQAAQHAGFARNLADSSDPVAAAFMARRNQLAAAQTPDAPAPTADADMLWQQIVAASPWPMSELREQFIKASGGVAPEDAGVQDLTDFLNKVKAAA